MSGDHPSREREEGTRRAGARPSWRRIHLAPRQRAHEARQRHQRCTHLVYYLITHHRRPQFTWNTYEQRKILFLLCSSAVADAVVLVEQALSLASFVVHCLSLRMLTEDTLTRCNASPFHLLILSLVSIEFLHFSTLVAISAQQMAPLASIETRPLPLLLLVIMARGQFRANELAHTSNGQS